jgi:hypothetical protein
MTFAQENGYVPKTFDEMMGELREAINAQFSLDFTEENFVGTSWYKFFYGPVQKAIQNEARTAEIFVKLQEYITTTNLRIQRPSISMPGIVDSFQSRGYVASVKQNAAEDAGTISICVDVDDSADDYADKRLEICGLIKDFTGAGLVSQGTEVESITLTNGQQFDFKYYLPNRTPILLKLTLTTSDNQSVVVPDDEEIRETLFNNIGQRYRLGWDFEPQRYFTQQDAPWAATILLEYSDDDGSSWESEVFEAEFDDLLTFSLEDISVVVD